jgi:HlyD family secretion protein
MRTLIKIVIVLAVLGGLGYLGVTKGGQWLAERSKPRFRTAKLETGDLRLTVNASGEIKPVLSVKIGSFVSGPILKLHVDFNDEVVKDQLLAEIDPRIYDAAVGRDMAALLTRKADLARVKAELQRAINDEKRSLALKAENADYIAQQELDQYRFSRESLEAQVSVAEAGIQQAQANLETSQANVNYTKITSPVDGMVIDRKIDPGQTLAASFQTPELFVIAPELRKKVHIFASVDEADIGLIKKAKESGQPVFFTVDAYPGQIFDKGYIEQIRLSSTVTQSVVTYPVIVASENSELKLLPGMTAQISFQVSELKDVLKIPNAALRFPPEKAHVRDQDQKYLELSFSTETESSDKATSSQEPPVDDAAKAAVAATKRIVWVQETAEEAGLKGPADPQNPYSGKLKAVEVTIGDSDYRFTHVLSGSLKASDEVVVGLKPAGAP